MGPAQSPGPHLYCEFLQSHRRLDAGADSAGPEEDVSSRCVVGGGHTSVTGREVVRYGGEMTIEETQLTGQPVAQRAEESNSVAMSRQDRAIVDAFTEVAVMSAQSSDLDSILHLVARRICELLSAQRCSIFLRDEDGLLHGAVLHACGIDIDSQVKGLSAPLDHDEFTRELIETKQVVVVEDLSRNAAPTTSWALPWTVHRGLGVPLLFDGPRSVPARLRVIGVVYIHTLDGDLPVTPSDIEIARTFSRLASFAIRHAWTMQRSVKRAEQVERQRNTLSQLNRAHISLTEGFVSGADLKGLIGRLVTLLRKPVTVYDENFRVIESKAPDGLAMTPGLPTQAVRSTWFTRQVTDLLPTRTSLMIPASPPVGLMSRRLVCPLRVDGARAGYLEVMELGQQIDLTDIKVAEHGATVISLQLLTERRADLAEEQAQADLIADFLDDLLRGSPNQALLMGRARQYGINLDKGHMVVRLAHDTSDDEGVNSSDRRRKLGRALAERTGLGCPATTTAPNADLFLLGPLPDDESVELAAVRQIVEDVLSERVGEFGVCFGAISRPCWNVRDYASADTEVAESVRFASATGRPVVVALQPEHGFLKVLLTGPDLTAFSLFAHELLDPLLAYDESNDGELLRTLRAYLLNDAKIRPTSEYLSVHENTIRYRLSKVQSVCSIDPGCLDDLLDLRLAIQVIDAAESSEQARLRETTVSTGATDFDENLRHLQVLEKRISATSATITA